MDIAYSKNNIPVRLTEERWVHIVENHNDLAGHYDTVLNAVEDPDFVVRGYKGCLIAIKGVTKKRYIAVVYKELLPNDGFVLTAYITSKISKKAMLWQREP